MIRQARIAVFLFSIFSFFFDASATNARDLPTWVENPKPSNSSVFYGIGQGGSLTTATQSALESIAGQLLVNIESILETHTVGENGSVVHSIDSQIRSQISATNLSGYKVDNVEKIKKDFWVQIRVDRHQLYQSNFQELNNLIAKIDIDPVVLSQKSVLQLHPKKFDISKTLHIARSKLIILKTLNAQFPYQRYLTDFSVFEKELDKKLKNTPILIVTTGDMEILGQRLASKLSEHGLITVRNRGSISVPQITLSGTFDEFEFSGNKRVSAQTTIEVIDEFGNSISRREIMLNGSALTSFKNARNAAVNKFLNDLESGGIANRIGLFIK